MATLLHEEILNAPLKVFSRFELESGLIRGVPVFYDSRRPLGGTENRS